jgi:alpha-tubulin suppressor-like RCC1 family protein
MWGKNITTPQKLHISGIKSCSAGANHVAFASEDGRAFLIGGNWNKQLGTASSMMSRDVYELDQTKLFGGVLSIECGSGFTCTLVQVQ